jgi:adenosine deaminase
MSAITVSDELHRLVEAFGYGWDELQWLAINAMKSAFWPFDQRLRIIEDRIKPGFAALRAEES